MFLLHSRSGCPGVLIRQFSTFSVSAYRIQLIRQSSSPSLSESDTMNLKTQRHAEVI